MIQDIVEVISEGPQGPRGFSGPAGLNGINGSNGTNGIDGTDGVDGVDGGVDNLFTFDSEQGVAVLDTAFQPYLNATISAAPIGVYRAEFNVAVSSDTTSRSVLIRIRSTASGVVGNWTVISREFKDTTDVLMLSYAYPIQHVAGSDVGIEIEVAKEGGAADITMLFGNLMVERKV